jgi:prepilin signal peptidase PulO-like enzyme (type II secretory pathway)
MKRTAKQIAALIGVALLVLLYVLLLVFALFDFEGSENMFRVCLAGTVAIPIFIWIYMYLYDKLVKNREGNGNGDDITIHK